jgi:hypothetical protein
VKQCEHHDLHRTPAKVTPPRNATLSQRRIHGRIGDSRPTGHPAVVAWTCPRGNDRTPEATIR